MKLLPFAFLASVIFTSCISIKPVEFKGIDQFTLPTSENSAVSFNLNVHNPNNWGVRITRLEAKLTLAEKQVGTAGLKNKVRAAANSDFIIPVEMILSQEEIMQIIQANPLSMLSPASLDPRPQGEIILKKFIFRKKFLFDWR
jgi:hypothetical protein